ncbi:TauD/TfdA family dioxygenase [Thalassobaculum sp.]|uniref:TauD/TfdA family dioxygenase n=1 Tax=Thalassobaculum sp. TaxID=2022740 RepID=UPI0032F03B98
MPAMHNSSEPALPPVPVVDPSAWLATDLQADSGWIQRLDDHEIHELDRAVESVVERGLRPGGFDRDGFPLTHLADRIAGWVHALEHGRGCVLVKGLDPGRYDDDALAALYWGLAVHLGDPIPQNAKGDLIGHVRDTGRDYTSKNVRGYTTRAELKAHCDASDIVGLLCRHPARSGGESLIASSTAIYNHLAAERPELIPPLLEGFHYDLRGEGVTDDPDETTFHRVPVFSWFEGRLSCRFNGKSIEEGMIKRGQPLSGLALEAVREVGRLAVSAPFRYDMTFEKGDLQLLSNHSILHSRAAFEDWPERERQRDLWRIWFNLRDGRPLAPEFADRLNTGPRGGVLVRGAG